MMVNMDLDGVGRRSAWARVKEYIEMNGSKYVFGIFVNFKGAFDNLKWMRMLEKLREIECVEIPVWRRRYFQGRQACMVSVNEVV